jgi:hypothetical protein
MRITNNPNVTCPDDLYTSEELARMEEIGDLEEQVQALDREIVQLDKDLEVADREGNHTAYQSLIPRYEDLWSLRDTLRQRITAPID